MTTTGVKSYIDEILEELERIYSTKGHLKPKKIIIHPRNALGVLAGTYLIFRGHTIPIELDEHLSDEIHWVIT